MAEANAYFLQQPDGWHVVIRFDDHDVLSNEAYATMEECKKAFDQWCIDTNSKLNRAS